MVSTWAPIYDDTFAKGILGFRFISVHKGILLKMQGCTKS